jgi:hypothetical protein
MLARFLWEHRECREYSSRSLGGFQLRNAAKQMRFYLHDGGVLVRIATLLEVPEVGAKHFDVASAGKIAHLQ